VQSIVGNAIKHGIGKRKGGGTVKICTSETDSEFLVTVSDDGVGFEYNKSAHNGRLCIRINNVRQMLSGQCGGSLEKKARKEQELPLLFQFQNLRKTPYLSHICRAWFGRISNKQSAVGGKNEKKFVFVCVFLHYCLIVFIIWMFNGAGTKNSNS
jgi:hypothetical protein